MTGNVSVNQLIKHPDATEPFVMTFNEGFIPEGASISQILGTEAHSDLSIFNPTITGTNEITLWIAGGKKNRDYAVEAKFMRSDGATMVAEGTLLVRDSVPRK